MLTFSILLSVGFLSASNGSLRQLSGIKSAVIDPLRRKNVIMEERVIREQNPKVRELLRRQDDDGYGYGGGGGGGGSPPPPPPEPCQYTPATATTPLQFPACPPGTPPPPYPAPDESSTPPTDDGGNNRPCPNCAIPKDLSTEIVLANKPWYIWVYEKATQLYKLYQAVKQAVTVYKTIVDVVKVIVANCIDGNMLLPMYPDGNVAVSSLQVGDVILGAKNANIQESWCTVLAVYPVTAGGVTFGGFTYDHLVVKNPFNNGTSASVTIAGQQGQENKGPIYTLMTDCDATYNTNGDLFTPISTAFCPNMPWLDYLDVMSAIRKVMAKTGHFWFDLDVYYDNPSDPNYPSYLAALPEICQQTLQCSKYGNCGQFEKSSSQFMLMHLKPAELAIVQKVFPNLGNVDSLDGTLTAVVLGNSDSTNSWQGILLIAGVIALVVLGVVAFFVWRMMKSPVGGKDEATSAAKKVQSEKDLDNKGIEFVTIMEEESATTAKDQAESMERRKKYEARAYGWGSGAGDIARYLKQQLVAPYSLKPNAVEDAAEWACILFTAHVLLGDHLKDFHRSMLRGMMSRQQFLLIRNINCVLVSCQEY
eukprot:gene31947-41441_t